MNYYEGMSFIEELRNFVGNYQSARNNVGDHIGRKVIDVATAPIIGPVGQIARETYRFLDAQGKGNVTKRLSEDALNNAKSEQEMNEGQEDQVVPAEEGEKVTEQLDVSAPKYDIDEMAGEFILGAWGNGQDRIDNMINAGYSLDDYNTIQQRVNEAYESGRDLHEWTNKANEKLHYW